MLTISTLRSSLSPECVYNRDAVVAVDRNGGQEADQFHPQKQTKLYGITTAYAQCPSGERVPYIPYRFKCLLLNSFRESALFLTSFLEIAWPFGDLVIHSLRSSGN